MGESIHFNTGFVYRFGTDGIVSFGGEEDALFEFSSVVWKESDIPIVFQELQKMILEKNLPAVQFDSYLKSKEGTARMLAELIVKDNIPNKYLMGCTIYHQLQYKSTLQADFLNGKPNDNHSDCDCCDSPISQTTHSTYDTDYDSE